MYKIFGTSCHQIQPKLTPSEMIDKQFVWALKNEVQTYQTILHQLNNAVFYMFACDSFGIQ